MISIAAVSGGGKTTITSRLNEVLNQSKAIYFDDYDLEGPEDIIAWVERGADCKEWNLDPIIADLQNLMTSGETDYILLDYPFSRLHNKLKNIDLTVFIDTPLDIAMARRLVRDFGSSSIEAVITELNQYLARGRMGYESMLNTTKPDSDLIIDGSLPVDEIVGVISSELAKLGWPSTGSSR